VAALEQRVDDLRGKVDRVPARKSTTPFAAGGTGGRNDISFCHVTFYYRTTLIGSMGEMYRLVRIECIAKHQ